MWARSEANPNAGLALCSALRSVQAVLLLPPSPRTSGPPFVSAGRRPRHARSGKVAAELPVLSAEPFSRAAA